MDYFYNDYFYNFYNFYNSKMTAINETREKA